MTEILDARSVPGSAGTPSEGNGEGVRIESAADLAGDGVVEMQDTTKHRSVSVGDDERRGTHSSPSSKHLSDR